jgi:hypothetical protein
MNKFVNLAILRNPLNWLTIGTMIILVIAAGFVIYTRLNAETAEPASNLAKEA